MDEGGRQSNDTNQRPQGILRFLGAGWVCVPSLVPCSLYPGTGNTLPLDQPVLSEPRRPDQRQSKGPPAFLGRPGLLGPRSPPTTGGSSLRPFFPDDPQCLKLGLCKASPQGRRAGSLRADRLLRRLVVGLLFSQPQGRKRQCQLGEPAPKFGLQRLMRVQKDGKTQEEEGAFGP